MEGYATKILFFIVVLSGDTHGCVTVPVPNWTIVDAQYFCNMDGKNVIVEWISNIRDQNTQNTIATCDTSAGECSNRDPCFNAIVSPDRISELKMATTYCCNNRVSVECYEIKDNKVIGQLQVQNSTEFRRTSTPLVPTISTSPSGPTEIQSSSASSALSSDNKTSSFVYSDSTEFRRMSKTLFPTTTSSLSGLTTMESSSASSTLSADNIPSSLVYSDSTENRRMSKTLFPTTTSSLSGLTTMESSSASSTLSLNNSTLTTANENASGSTLLSLGELTNSKAVSQTTDTAALNNQDGNVSSRTTEQAVSPDITQVVTTTVTFTSSDTIVDHTQTAEALTTAATFPARVFDVEALFIGAAAGCLATLFLVCLIFFMYRRKHKVSLHPPSAKPENNKSANDYGDEDSEGYMSRRSSSKGVYGPWEDFHCPCDLAIDSPCYVITEVARDDVWDEIPELIDNSVYSSSEHALTKGID